MDIRQIHEQDLKKSRIRILNIGGVIVDRPFEKALYLAPFAPHNEIISLFKQVPKEDREEVRRLWGLIQREIRYQRSKK